MEFNPIEAQGSGESVSIEQFIRDYEPGADIASVVRVGSQADYWARPENLGRWYEMYEGMEPDDTAPEWLDGEGLKIAYDYMTRLNDGKHWSAWDTTPGTDDPIWDYFKTLQKPPEEETGLLPAETPENVAFPVVFPPTETIQVPGTTRRGAYGQIAAPISFGNYETFGYTEEEWNQLTPWQQWAERIFNTGNTSNVAIGAIGGLQGGPLGALTGGVLGGVIGKLITPPPQTTYEGQYPGAAQASQTYWNPDRANVIVKALETLNALAEGTKRTAGTAALIGLGALGSLTGDEQFPTIDQVMGNIGAAWEVSQLTYRVVPTGELLKAAATPASPQAIMARMGVQYSKLVADNLERLGVDIPDWLTEGIETAGPYLEGNPWAVLAAREKGKPETAWTMGTTDVRQLKNSEVGYAALVEAFKRVVEEDASMDSIFAEYQQRFGFEGEMRELFGSMLADPLNFAGVAMVKGAAKGAKIAGMSADLVNALDSSTGVVEGLRKYRGQARLMQGVDEVKGIERWLGGAWTKEGKAKILEKPQYGNKLEEAWGYTTSLTREAKAKEVTDGMGLNLIGVLDRADYDLVTMQKYVDGIANSDPRVVAEIGLRSLGGSEAAALPMALRDFSPKGRAMVESWSANSWSREILQKIARVTGRTADDILKSLDDISGKEADVLARQFADAARASTDEAAQAVAKAFDDGQLNGAKLQEWSKVFVKDRAPLIESDFMSRYFTAMMDHVEQWTVKYFGVKPDPWIFRFSNTIKNAQGMLLLDFSPNYMFQNGIDNAFKLAYEGVLGFESKGKRDGFYARFGEVFRDRRETFIQREKSVRGPIAEAKIQKGPQETLNQGIRSVRRKIGLASEGSSKLEAWSSNTASYHGIIQAWNYMWQPGKGFDRVWPELQRELDAISPGLSRTIESKIRAGLNKAEIEKSIWEAVGRKTIDDILPDVADALQIDEAGARDALHKTGAYEYLRDNIPENATDADIVKAFEGLKDHISKQFDDWTKQRLATEVDKAKNASKAEGALGIIDLYDEVALDEAITHIGGYDGWERVYEMENLVGPNEFSRLLDEQRKRADAKWNRTWNRRRANYLGITEQLGLGDGYARFIETNLIDQEANWAEFHKLKWDAWKDAKKAMGTPEWAQVRDQVRAQIREAFVRSTETELSLQRALDGELVKVLEQWYGPEIAETARAWRGGLAEIREDMTRQMVSFRERIDALNPDQKRSAWNKFLTEEYKPAIVERMHQNITGAHEVWRLASEVDVTPPKPEAIVPAMKWVEEARAQLFKERYQLTPEQVGNVNEIRRIASEFGIASAKADGTPDPGFNKRLLATVKKHGGGEFAKVEDLTPEVVRRALEERNRIKAGGAPAETVQEPALLAEIPDIDHAELTALAGELESQHIRKYVEQWRKSTGWERRRVENAELRRQIEVLSRSPQAEIPRVTDFNRAEIDAYPTKLYVDLAGLGYINDKLGGHVNGGDKFLKAFGNLTKELGYKAWHDHGDEFILAFDSIQAAQEAAKTLEERMLNQVIMFEVGGERQVWTGFDLHTGIGETIKDADIAAAKANAEYKARYGLKKGDKPANMRRVETGETVGINPDPVGIAPPGTVEGLYDPDIGKLFENGWDETIFGVLDSVQEKMLGPDSQVMGLKDANLTPEQALNLRKYLEQQYAKMSDTKMAAKRAGEVKRNIALLNYDHRYGFDNLLGVVMPYQFWYTRSAINWALRAIDHPAYLVQYGRIRNAQERLSRSQEGFPARLRGKMAIPMPWLPEGWGNTVYVDPLHQVFNFEGMIQQTIRPLQQDQANRIKKAEYLIQQMVADGQITEQQATLAIKERSGALWSQAMTRAQMEVEAEVANPLDLVNTMTAFSWPLQLAYQKAMKRESKISVPPSLQTITNITSFFTPGGVNAGGWLQKALGAPERGFLHNYYVERELRNMVVNGELDVEEAIDAMVDEKGEAWTRALDRVGKQQAIRSFTAQLWLDFFPEGEQEARALQQEFSAAMDAGNGAAFFDAHPEWEAQLLLSNWDDPEERMKRYLIGAVWDAYNGMETLEKREAAKQLGKLFQESFLNKETRSYDSIELETIAMWAEMMGGRIPESAPELPQMGALELPDAETSANYQLYLDTRKEQFPNAALLQEMYYRLPEAMRAKFLRNSPELREYWEWRDGFIADNPDLIPYLTGEESRLAGVSPEIQQQVYAYKGEKAKYFPGIGETQNRYYELQGAERKAYLLDHPELVEYWDWQRTRLAQSPEIIPYIKSTETIAKAVLGEDYQAGYRVDSRNFDGVLSTELLAYTLTGKPLGAGVKEALREIWKKEKSGLTYEAWLDQVYQLFAIN